MTGEFIQYGIGRWLHIMAGVMWIGHLYFFNWVNAHFAKALDGPTKKIVVPELMPRALYWFRWGAAFTWVPSLLWTRSMTLVIDGSIGRRKTLGKTPMKMHIATIRIISAHSRGVRSGGEPCRRSRAP